ncbi:hypothetical protein D0T50_06210 [Bacteroides sp. 214]|nr:hypothetical protein [Bacteroides sp. 214]
MVAKSINYKLLPKLFLWKYKLINLILVSIFINYLIIRTIHFNYTQTKRPSELPKVFFVRLKGLNRYLAYVADFQLIVYCSTMRLHKMTAQNS